MELELSDQWFRPAAYYLIKERGIKQKEVARLFGVSEQRVSRLVKRFNETKSHDDRQRSGRPSTARTPLIVSKVKKLLRRNNHTKARHGVSGRSTTRIAARMGISQMSAWRILRKNLGLKPWKKKKGQKLTAAAKNKRLNRAKALKERLADGRHRLILFSDEKYFTIEEGYNSQNDRIWSADSERIVERQMKPKGVMVWAGVGYNAKAPLVFVKAGIKIDTDVYRRDILKPVERWAVDHYGIDEEGYWHEWTFQQDGAPSHTSINENSDKFRVPTQTWLEEHFPDFIKKDEWPPSSPDLNPLDYSIWPILASEVNAQAHSSVESLKEAITKAFDNLSQDTINNAIDTWMKRLDSVIEARGGHFE